MGYHSSTFDPKKHTRYQPINEEKYVGKEYPCCRSSWETHFCKWCDNNPSIIKWSSEAIQIPYYDPVRRKNRRYYPDFSMSVKGSDGKVINYIVEIKPKSQTDKPINKGKNNKTYLYEFYTYQTNIAKWRAAIEFCRKHGFVFKLLTEYDLFKDGKM